MRFANLVLIAAPLLLATPVLPRTAGAQQHGAAASTHAAAPALDDPTIAAIFDAANGWDMETGALAARRGRSAAVREFGRMLQRDHRQVRQQGRDLLHQLHVRATPPKDFAMARDHAAAMRALRTAPSAAFDSTFLAHEVAFHQAVIDAVTNTLLPAIQNGQLKHLVVTVAPAFAAHRDRAKQLLAGR